MSKRCKLQKEYYKEFGNYKGSGKYTDHYVSWLESRVLALTIPVVVSTCCDEHRTVDEMYNEISKECRECGKELY